MQFRTVVAFEGQTDGDAEANRLDDGQGEGREGAPLRPGWGLGWSLDLEVLGRSSEGFRWR